MRRTLVLATSEHGTRMMWRQWGICTSKSCSHCTLSSWLVLQAAARPKGKVRVGIAPHCQNGAPYLQHSSCAMAWPQGRRTLGTRTRHCPHCSWHLCWQGCPHGCGRLHGFMHLARRCCGSSLWQSLQIGSTRGRHAGNADSHVWVQLSAWQHKKAES